MRATLMARSLPQLPSEKRLDCKFLITRNRGIISRQFSAKASRLECRQRRLINLNGNM